MLNKQEKQLIMVVENNEQILFLTKEILEMNHYQVETFQDFLIALDYYKANYTKVTALLLDMQLENKNDYLITIPSFLDISQNVPIIGMSGEITLKDIPEPIRLKITHFLRKPFEMKQLLDLLARIG